MKEIELTQNKVAIVDDEDFMWLSMYQWQARKDRENYYAQKGEYLGKDGNTYKTTTIQMSRFILGIEDSNIKVDHGNGNTLDNRKSNLRIATIRQNNCNLHELKSNNTTGYRGVTKRNDKIDGNMWRARIYLEDGRRKTLGHFSTPEEAAKAYDKAAREIYGEFCGKLNFEEK